MTNQEFINLIANKVKNENEKRGNPLFSSVVIAQACLETGYGKSSMMMKANALFGIKACSNWKGLVYSSKTREVYNNTSIYINDTFRAYNSIDESISDYFELITKTERYRKSMLAETPKECIEAIKNGGYATDPEYVKLILNIIKIYNLTIYDKKEQNNYFVKGKNYSLQVDLKVRAGAGTYYDVKKYNDLTLNAKIHAYKQDYAVLKKGTIVTCLDVIYNNSDVWLKIPSGYVAGFYNNKYYIK